MRNALMFSLLLMSGAVLVGQAPAGRGAQPAPAQGTTKPQTPPATGAQRRPAQPATTGRSGMAIVVTDLRGVPLPDIAIDVDGPVKRAGKTNDIGQESLMTMPAGTYRVVFSGETVTALEREVTLKASAVMPVEVALKPAPPPKEIVKEIKAPAPEAPPPTVGPAGQPQILSLVDLVEKEYERKLDRRESLVACSGNTRSTLLQINQDQPARLYEDAESLFYVVAGEGFVQINGKESRLQAGGFASVPRATSYVLGRRGRNPLVVLSVLSGEPCEQAR